MNSGNHSDWDEEVDVLVAGSGAGGMAAALSAAHGGLKVLVVEKTDRIGGSTAISGGAVWAPLNAQSEPCGHPDTRDAVRTYLRNTVGDSAPVDLQDAFVDAAASMVDWFERHTEVRLTGRTHSPDYYPDRDGAAMGGRTLDPKMFDGRLLGSKFRELRNPLPEFLVLGGMMVTMTDAKHLLRATRSLASFRESMRLVLRYVTDRVSGHHRGTRLVLGNALAARLFRSLLDRQVAYWLDAPLNRLHLSEGRVEGATVRRRGRDLAVRTRRGVVLAGGGFPWHESLRDDCYPKPTGPWSMSPPGNSGDTIALARGIGGALGEGQASCAFWAPVSILQRPDGSVVRYPHLVWDRAKPGLMAVNGAGERFVNESTSYHEFVLGMYRAHRNVPTVPAFLVCDSEFVEKWGLGLALPGGRSREHLVRAGYLHRAQSLRELGRSLGIDGNALDLSAQRFNLWATLGRDDDFGKGSTAYNRYLGDPDHGPNPCLGPIRRAPFYAVKVVAGDIGTALGLRCNADAQVLDDHGQAIRGLYAVGNDMHSVMGGQYPAPGITLGPALTFGWLAGRHLTAATGTITAAETAQIATGTAR